MFQLLKPSTIRRLFILRPDNLGDLVIFSGALKHLRRQWPEAKITLAVRSFGIELFKHCPHIDELVSFEKLQGELFGQGRLPWMPGVRGSDRLGDWMRNRAPTLAFWRYRCDLAVMPLISPMGWYHQLMRRIPARRRFACCGNLSNQTAEEDMTARAWYSEQMEVSGFPFDLPELESTGRWLNALGIKTEDEDLWPEFWTTQEAQRRAEKLLCTSSVRLRLGIAPGVASLPGKNLPASWFAEVLSALRQPAVDVVCFGSTADLEVCSSTSATAAKVGSVAGVLNLAGKTSVLDLIECMKRCDVFLCQETAALHIATALRKPVVAILGGGHYGRFYPWGESATSRVVSKKMDCYGCNWHCQHETVRCIQEIPSGDAAAELRLLAEDVVRQRKVTP